MVFRVLLPGGRVKNFKGEWKGEGSPVGWRVLVPSGEGGTTGVVVGVSDASEEAPDIIAFPDRAPLIGQAQLSLVEELSLDYLLPKGVLLFKLIPSAFLWKEEELVVASKREVPGLDRVSSEVFEYVRRRRGVKLESLKKRFDPKLIKTLVSKGILKREKRWTHTSVEERFYRLAVPLKEALPKVRSGEKRRLIVFMSGRDWVGEDEILSWGFKKSLLRDLARKGILEVATERPDTEEKAIHAGGIVKKLGEERNLVWDRLESSLEVLLQGIVATLEEGRSILLLGVGAQVLDRARDYLRGRIGERVKEIRSGLSPRRIMENWFGSQEEPSVVIGSYSASLCPAKDIGLVVLLGESSPGVKIRSAGGVDMRRLSYILARKTASRLIFATQAPSLSSYRLVSEGKMHMEGPPKDLPAIELLPREARDILTETARREIDRNKHKEILFLVPKQGYSYTYCPRCESLVHCPECGTFLTYSRTKEMLYCTACHYKAEELVCPECEGDLEELGFGIEKVVEVVENNFSLRENFHFATYPPWSESYDLTLVISADSILSVPSYRAEEELFLYLTKALLISREKLLIQTMFPDEEVFSLLKKKEFDRFYREELDRRKRELLPPFWRMLLIKATKREVGGYAARFLSSHVRTSFNQREGVYEILVRFRDRKTLWKVSQLRKRFGKDIIEVKVDPF